MSSKMSRNILIMLKKGDRVRYNKSNSIGIITEISDSKIYAIVYINSLLTLYPLKDLIKVTQVKNLPGKEITNETF